MAHINEVYILMKHFSMSAFWAQFFHMPVLFLMSHNHCIHSWAEVLLGGNSLISPWKDAWVSYKKIFSWHFKCYLMIIAYGTDKENKLNPIVHTYSLHPYLFSSQLLQQNLYNTNAIDEFQGCILHYHRENPRQSRYGFMKQTHRNRSK